MTCRSRSTALKTMTALALFAFSTAWVSESNATVKGVGTVRVGAAFPSISFPELGNFDINSGVDVGLTLGAQFGDYFRLDAVDFSYLGASTLSGGIKTDDLVLIIGTGVRIGLFKATMPLHPYLSVGVGGAYGRETVDGLDEAAGWGFEWSVGTGLEYQVARNFGIGLRYRYRSSTINYLTYTGGFPPYFYVSPTVSAHTLGVELSFMGP